MAIHSKKVFLAADALTAFVDRAHPKHLHSAAFFRYFAQEGFQLFTTLTEINTANQYIYSALSPSLSKEFIKGLSLSAINILTPDDTDIRATYKTMLSNSTTEMTFAEALITTLANRRNIPQICTFSYIHLLFGIQLFYLPL